MKCGTSSPRCMIFLPYTHKMGTLCSKIENMETIYGGSVSPDNAQDILNTKIVDGALVGGASLDATKFVDIIKAVEL